MHGRVLLPLGSEHADSVQRRHGGRGQRTPVCGGLHASGEWFLGTHRQREPRAVPSDRLLCEAFEFELASRRNPSKPIKTDRNRSKPIEADRSRKTPSDPRPRRCDRSAAATASSLTLLLAPCCSDCPGAALDTEFGGSKPIIAESGKQTREAHVEVTEVILRPAVSTTITLQRSLEDVDAPTLTASLAALYGVTESSIRLELTSGSVILGVQIIASNATNTSALAAAVLSVADSALTVALGGSATRADALETVLNVTVRSNQTVQEQDDCPVGHWCTAGLLVAWCVASSRTETRVEGAEPKQFGRVEPKRPGSLEELTAPCSFVM